MCETIIINRGEKEIETPQEFLDHFGFKAQKNEHYKDVDMNSCLCQCDIASTLTAHNIPFKTDCMEFYVGDLENVKFD